VGLRLSPVSVCGAGKSVLVQTPAELLVPHLSTSKNGRHAGRFRGAASG